MSVPAALALKEAESRALECLLRSGSLAKGDECCGLAHDACCLQCRYLMSFGSKLTPLGPLGKAGSGAALGQPPEFYLPRGLQAAPWSATTVLVADSGNGRVVEVDVLQRALVKVRPCICWMGAAVWPGVQSSPWTNVRRWCVLFKWAQLHCKLAQLHCRCGLVMWTIHMELQPPALC